jgi:HPt (histidine-containing phosphotransfer) domain-containing protein
MRMLPKCLDAEVLDRIKRQRSEAFLAGLIGLFLEEGPARLEEAWEGGKARDWRKAAVAAHILRCLADNIGALAVRDLAAEAEAACAADPAARAALARILFDLEIAFAETRSCLACARSGPPGPHRNV